jgi:hypothetical protein
VNWGVQTNLFRVGYDPVWLNGGVLGGVYTNLGFGYCPAAGNPIPGCAANDQYVICGPSGAANGQSPYTSDFRPGKWFASMIFQNPNQGVSCELIGQAVQNNLASRMTKSFSHLYCSGSASGVALDQAEVTFSDPNTYAGTVYAWWGTSTVNGKVYMGLFAGGESPYSSQCTLTTPLLEVYVRGQFEVLTNQNGW